VLTTWVCKLWSKQGYITPHIQPVVMGHYVMLLLNYWNTDPLNSYKSMKVEIPWTVLCFDTLRFQPSKCVHACFVLYYHRALPNNSYDCIFLSDLAVAPAGCASVDWHLVSSTHPVFTGLDLSLGSFMVHACLLVHTLGVQQDNPTLPSN
jgi:hypothetical protein